MDVKGDEMNHALQEKTITLIIKNMNKAWMIMGLILIPMFSANSQDRLSPNNIPRRMPGVTDDEWRRTIDEWVERRAQEEMRRRGS